MAVYVPGVLGFVGPVLGTVVFDCQFPFSPAHVEADCATAGEGHSDLGFWAWEAGRGKEEAGSGFLGRFRAGVDVGQDSAEGVVASRALVVATDFGYLFRANECDVAECVQCLDSLVEWQASAEVVARSCRSCDSHSGDPLNLSGVDIILPGNDSRRWAGYALGGQLDGLVDEPSHAMEGAGRESGEDCPTLRPAGSGVDSRAGIQVNTLAHVDVWMDALKLLAQLPFADHACSYRFGATKRFVESHIPTVTGPPDMRFGLSTGKRSIRA
ncbi:hypothetical protein AB0N05_32980 [Nocardia sp. NPDC051030]|uniref:hypothetical protein n=1 Tax=Nocardia sp. NPDC051030 TaxID=3155162 RepID=UPI00341AA676